MQIDRDELFRLMGIPPTYEAGHTLNLATEDGIQRASVSWSDGDFHATVSAEIDGESGDTVVSIDGSYFGDGDYFDLDGHDNRPEASDPSDLRAAATAFRFMTIGMAPAS